MTTYAQLILNGRVYNLSQRHGKSCWSFNKMIIPETIEVSEKFPKLRIAMVSDFFIPGLGGVEMHIYNVAQQLIKRGYKVIIITHLRGNKNGIRYLANGLKVYYIPTVPMVDQVSFPHLVQGLPLFRRIFIRERIDIVHAHQATAVIAQDCLFHAKTLGIRTVFTDHSLFGFADAACIHINQVIKLYLHDVDHACAVSNTNRENLVLRAAIPPSVISVIPNAVDCSKFTPDLSKRTDDGILTIVVLSRLTYRKGVDLLADVIPASCRKYPNIRWIIGGDGPKRLLLEEMREKHRLHHRVEFLGAVPHHDVPSVLRRGHIFVNSSLTEAFCIAIVEAASCGLLVVSTAVGGVPEVLPSEMVRLAEADSAALEAALDSAIFDVDKINPFAMHEKVKNMYSWSDVAARTELIYQRATEKPGQTVHDRMERVLQIGPIGGLVWLFVQLMDFIFGCVLQLLYPAHTIEISPDFPTTYARKEAIKETQEKSVNYQDSVGATMNGKLGDGYLMEDASLKIFTPNGPSLRPDAGLLLTEKMNDQSSKNPDDSDNKNTMSSGIEYTMYESKINNHVDFNDSQANQKDIRLRKGPMSKDVYS